MKGLNQVLLFLHFLVRQPCDERHHLKSYCSGRRQCLVGSPR